MTKRILILISIAVIYLGVAYLIQPKLREVLRAPEKINQESKIENQNVEDTISYDCEMGKTAYDLLLEKTNNQVEIKEYSFGKLVDTINGLKGGIDGKYWLYFVDGKSASLSADNYHCQNKEKVEWKFSSEH